MEDESKFKEEEELAQIVKGVVEDTDNWWEQLPPGIKKEDVYVRRIRTNRGNLLEWHLIEERLKNPSEEQRREARAFEREMWGGDW